MSRAAPPQFSFASGEISELLHGRPDYQRYQTGLRRCRGFLPLAEGPCTRMPGTRHAGTTRNNAPAIIEPFIFAEDDTHVLEFTSQKMRVWQNGALVESSPGVPYELTVPWLEADLPNLCFAQSASRLYVCDGKRPPRRISRLAPDDWTIEPVPFERGPFRPQNLDESVTITASATTGSITLTASEPIFNADHQGSFWRLVPEDLTDVPYWTSGETITTGDRMRYDGRVYELANAATSTGPNPPTHSEGTRLMSKDGPEWKYLHSDVGLVKIIGGAGGTTALAQIIGTLPETLTAPTYQWSEGAWSLHRGYPAAIAFHEQRLVLAATPDNPQTIWFSTVGDFVNFEPGLDADSSFAYAISTTGNRVNTIRWIMSGGRTLHIGTTGAEYSARASSADVVIGPTNAVFRPDTTEGSARIMPLVVDGAPVFVSRNGSRVHELSYDFGQDSVDAPEISRAARHLFKRTSRIVWQTSPLRVLWAATANGLAALCYDKRQDQLGSALSALAGGIPEGLAVIPTPDGTEEQLWLVVRRGTSRHVEIMQPVFGLVEDAEMADAWHFWDALAYDGAATGTFSGLDHIEDGTEVHAWTERGHFGPLTVTGGSVTLPDSQTVTRAVVGRHDPLDHMETLHQSAGARDGGSQGRQANTRAAGVRMFRTGGGSLSVVTRQGRSVSTSRPRRVVPPMRGDAFALPELFTGVIDEPALAKWGKENTMLITPDPGAPLTLAGITPIQDMADGQMCPPLLFPAAAVGVGAAGVGAAGAGAAAAGAGAAAAGGLSLGTILQGAGLLASVVGTLGAASSASATARANAALAAQQSEARRRTGEIEERRSRQEFREIAAQQRASLAASGVRLDSPTALEIGVATAEEAERDAAAVRYGAQSSAHALDAESALYRSQARNQRQRGYFGAASRILTGGTELWKGLRGA